MMLEILTGLFRITQQIKRVIKSNTKIWAINQSTPEESNRN